MTVEILGIDEYVVELVSNFSGKTSHLGQTCKASHHGPCPVIIEGTSQTGIKRPDFRALRIENAET